MCLDERVQRGEIAGDARREQLMVGVWLSEEIAGVNQNRMRRGDSPLPELVKTVPHVAFEVDDLEAALEGHEVLIPANSPSAGIRVAFIVHNGAPVEFLQIEKG